MKRKCIFLFLLIILFSFMMSSFCLAEFSFSVDDTTYTYDTLVLDVRCPYLFITDNASYYMLYCFSSEPIITANGIFQTFERYEAYYLRKNNKYELFTSGSNVNISGGVTPKHKFVWSNFDITDNTGKIIFTDNSFVKPFIENKEEIQTGKFDKIVVNSGGYNKHSLEEFYLFSYYYAETVESLFIPMEMIYFDGTANQYFVGAAENRFLCL